MERTLHAPPAEVWHEGGTAAESSRMGPLPGKVGSDPRGRRATSLPLGPLWGKFDPWKETSNL